MERANCEAVLARARPNVRFQRFWRGDGSDYATRSEADAARAMHLDGNCDANDEEWRGAWPSCWSLDSTHQPEFSMTRQSFTCTHCSTVLATTSAANVLQVTAGVAVTHNRRFGTLELRCPCGQLERFAVPRRVEVLVIGGVE